jgi:hypothetical protein
MENHINLDPPANNYLEHFRRALINLEKLSREEARKRSLLRRKVKATRKLA